MTQYQETGTNVIGGVGNSVLKGEGFYVSYNPDTSSGLPMVGSMFAGDGSGEETALVKDGAFRILNGDWRKQYAELVPQGWQACLDLFERERAEHGSSWTTPGLYDDH